MATPRDTAGDPPHAFWQFSLAVYGQAPVRTECLALQDAHGVDVNVLLFCAWMGAERGIVLDEMALARASRSVEDWSQQVVSPLRAARRSAKRLGKSDVHESILRVELQAERAAQDILFELNNEPRAASSSRASTSQEAARENIRLLLAHCPVTAAFPHALLLAACAGCGVDITEPAAHPLRLLRNNEER